jgi:glycosyltransferase involved in cell wall biosynthesis
MDGLTVSVALCTCNGADYVEEQVRSILAQSRPVLELVVRDDASDDDTVQRLEAVYTAHVTASGQAPALRVTRNPQRLGVARNFEAALLECRGDLVALSDQDDRWDPQRLASLVPRFIDDPALLLLHGDARLIGGDDSDLGSTLFHALGMTKSELQRISQGQGWQVLLDRNLVTGATVLLRRTLLEHALPIPPHWIHDEWLGMVAALRGGLQVEPRPLLAYRQHGRNQIGARRARLDDLILRALSRRGEWHAVRLGRANELAERAIGLADQIPPQALGAVAEKLLHQQARAALPGRRLARLRPVWREWRTGRYAHYGRGWQGVLRDLLQPD